MRGVLGVGVHLGDSVGEVLLRPAGTRALVLRVEHRDVPDPGAVAVLHRRVGIADVQLAVVALAHVRDGSDDAARDELLLLATAAAP